MCVGPAAVARICSRRTKSTGPVRLPVAAVKMGARDSDVTLLLIAFVDVTWATVDIHARVLATEIPNAYKGQGKAPSSHEAFRPLDLAEPILALVVDILRIRTGIVIRCYVGRRQLGGEVDPRAHILSFRVGIAMRRRAGLPSVDLMVDARLGYDGGRRAQVLLFFRKRALLVSVVVRDQVIAMLDPVKLVGGGMVQGRSVSGDLYSTLPTRCEERLRAFFKMAASWVDPALTTMYHATKAHDLVTDLTVDLEATRFRAWRLEKLLEDVRVDWTQVQLEVAKAILTMAAIDAECL